MKNNIRIGKISAIDYASGLVRVVYHDKDNAVTGLIPLLSNEYFMPKVGAQVIVLHLSNGVEAGVVLGCPWSEKTSLPRAEKTFTAKIFRTMTAKPTSAAKAAF